MGSALQRLEILLIGLIMLIAGAVVAVIMVVRPTTPASVPITPQPVATSAAGRATRAPIVQPTTAPATIASVATSAPLPTAAPQPSAEPAQRVILPRMVVPPTLSASWPWLLLASLMCAGLVGSRIQRRRMSYTHQSVAQLLATAVATTRAANLTIMQRLAAQGLLTEELAAAAGIDLAQPHQRRALRLPRLRLDVPCFTLPRVTLPALRLSVVRLPRPRLLRRTQRPISIHLAPAAPAAPAPDMGGASSDALPPALSDTARRAVLDGHTVVVPEVEHATRAMLDVSGEGWTPEDRALAVATVITAIWSEAGASREAPIQSPILALDTASAPGDGQVVVTIDGHPDDEATLLDLPEQIVARRPTWRAAWRQGLLDVMVGTDDEQPPVGGPLLVPILARGRGGKTLRFYPLTIWRHLGLYGANALGALHAMLGSLLYAQPPSNMALAIIDGSEITPLYRNVAHLVPLPGSPRETIARLAQAITRGAHTDVRPLVLVVVEPDDTMLSLVLGIAARLQARPASPVHLLLAQARVRSAGRELYTMLPAMITSGGGGTTAVLPGPGDWPKRGAARLVGRGMRIEGRAITLDEAAIVAQVTQLRGQPTNLPPVLWDAPPHRTVLPTAMRVRDTQLCAVDADGVDPEDRIAHAEPIADAAPDEHNLAVNDHDARAPEVMADARSAHTEPAIGSAVTPAGAAAEPDLIAAPHTTPAPVTSAARGAALADTTDQAAPATDEPVAAPDTSASRRAALLRASRETGSAAAAPLQLVHLHPNAPRADAPPIGASAPAAPAEPPPMVEPDNGFPVGPAPLGRVAMAEVLARLVATPAIVAGQANELGVTKNRLVELLKGAHKAQAKELAEILMVWLDHAGLLIEPTKPGRLRHPRALTTTNLAEIAARLHATPCPDKRTVMALWSESNEGRS